MLKQLPGFQVQHSHMTDTAVADHATVSLIVNTLHRLFPSLDYRYNNALLRIIFFLEANNYCIQCQLRLTEGLVSSSCRWLVDEIRESLFKASQFHKLSFLNINAEISSNMCTMLLSI